MPVAVDETAPPAAKLSAESSHIIAHLPIAKDKSDGPPHIPSTINIDHATIDPVISAKEDVKEHNGVGITIKMRGQNVDVNLHLEKAYQAAMNGDLQNAAMLYSEVLKVSPKNTQALFGLASVDQKMGKLDEARPLYGELLKIDPHHQGALNNFLVLAGAEAPEDALQKLRILETKNPDTSPLPAQIGIICEKLGRHEEAVYSTRRALALAPDNITYRYNLAIMLDHQKDWKSAADVYLQLIAAADRGESLPASRPEIQERLTFIRNNLPPESPVGAAESKNPRPL